MDADVKPDYSLPDDDDLADLAKTNTVSEKPKRKKRGLKKKDKQALGVGRRATVRHEPQSPKQRSGSLISVDAKYLFQDPKLMAQYQPGFCFEGAGLESRELEELEREGGGTKGAVLDQLWDLNDRDNDYAFYRDAFTGKDHWNFLSSLVPSTGGPMAVSIIRTGDFYTALVRTPHSNERREQECSQTVENAIGKLLRRGQHNPKSVLKSICPELTNQDLSSFEFFASEAGIPDPLPELLLTLHDRQRVTGFKFGVLYAGRNQTKETEFFSNNATSPMFEEFLSFLGDKIELDGWDGFRGGLDVKSGSTGKHAVYSLYNPGNCPVLFHVAPWLPFDPNNDQQLERKRHIGNDLVVIVFQESAEAIFKPGEISSRMIHVVILVRPVKFADRPDETWYRVAVIRKIDTPLFAPVLENVSLFKKGKAFRDLLYQKLLNAERACYAAPILSKKMQNTRNLLLVDCIRQIKK